MFHFAQRAPNQYVSKNEERVSSRETGQQTAVHFSSVQDGIYAFGKALMRSTPSLGSFHNVAFETVPMFVWLTMALSRPFKEALPLSTPLSSRRSVV